ncbi:MAG: DKNYY domain-containing protein [Bdellovibrionaceae bacterium]|nr:DKNYY domain-containing protein [Pseudobdellovibrionaceae bacterium]
MKYLFFALFIFSIIPNGSYAFSPAPADFYYAKNGKVFFENTETTAHLASFSVLHPSEYFAKDQEHIYFKGKSIPDVSAENFKATYDLVGTDGKTVILLDHTNPLGYSVQTFQDFKILSDHYYVGDGQMYFLKVREPYNGSLKRAELVAVPKVTPENFLLVYKKTGQDISDVFNVIATTDSHFMVCEHSHPLKKSLGPVQILSSEKEIGTYFSANKQVYYVHGCKLTLVKDATPQNFKILTPLIATDGKRFLKYGEPLEFTYKGQAIKPNVKEFLVIEKVWGKYQDSLYYIFEGQFQEYKNVDFKTFEILRNYCKEGIGCIHLAQDSRHYFYRSGQSLIDSDDANITYVMQKYPNHRKAVYLYGLLLDKVDPDTYRSLDSSRYGVDANSLYYNNVPVQGADIKSLTVLDHGYAKDQFSVYLHGRKIISADAFSFKRRFGKFSDRSTSTKQKIWEDKRYYFNQDGKIVSKKTPPSEQS